MMREWSFGGRKYPFDISEAGCIQRLTEAYGALRENDVGETADRMESYCCTIAEFFDILFGEGAGAAVCGTILNGEDCSAAYLSFLEYISAQTEEITQRRKAMEARYLRRLDEVNGHV